MLFESISRLESIKHGRRDWTNMSGLEHPAAKRLIRRAVGLQISREEAPDLAARFSGRFGIDAIEVVAAGSILVDMTHINVKLLPFVG